MASDASWLERTSHRPSVPSTRTSSAPCSHSTRGYTLTWRRRGKDRARVERGIISRSHLNLRQEPVTWFGRIGIMHYSKVVGPSANLVVPSGVWPECSNCNPIKVHFFTTGKSKHQFSRFHFGYIGIYVDGLAFAATLPTVWRRVILDFYNPNPNPRHLEGSGQMQNITL